MPGQAPAEAWLPGLGTVTAQAGNLSCARKPDPVASSGERPFLRSTRAPDGPSVTAADARI